MNLVRKEVKTMVDQIYELLSAQNLILLFSLFISFDFLINYLIDKYKVKTKKKIRTKKIKQQNHIVDWKI